MMDACHFLLNLKSDAYAVSDLHHSKPRHFTIIKSGSKRSYVPHFPMDGFQFVFESPQAAQNHKKRPRLVTSCDNCRLKKIKCLQASPDSKCEACSQAKVSCRFNDRERYFVERSRVMAGPGSRSDIQNQSVRKLEEQPGFSRHELCNPLGDSTLDAFTLPSTHCRNQSFPSDPVRLPGRTTNRDTQSQSAPPSPTFGQLNDPSVFNLDLFAPDLNQTFPLFNQQSVSFPIFDLNQPQYPNCALMPHYIHLFIQHFGAKCPYITYSDTLERFTRGILPPLLSNSIAALAVRFSDLPELMTQGLESIANSYEETAKTILPAVMYPPSMETLHALMLLAWSEYHQGEIDRFRAYCEMAMRMALHLGLSDNRTLRLNISEHGRNQLHVTWSAVLQLDLLASNCA